MGNALETTDSRFAEYQALVNGRLVSVSTLTLEQAQKALCDAYDFIEEIEDISITITEKIDKWRTG